MISLLKPNIYRLNDAHAVMDAHHVVALGARERLKSLDERSWSRLIESLKLKRHVPYVATALGTDVAASAHSLDVGMPVGCVTYPRCAIGCR